MVIQFYQWCAEYIPIEQVKFLALLETEDDILGLQVGVNDVAYPVQIVESHENLPRDLADYGNRNTFIIVFLYQ